MAITKIYKGSLERSDINKIYKGTTLLYEKSSLPSRYVQTTIADFNANGDYIGAEEYIILPADKPSGYKIVNLNVKGVATNGDYLTDTSYMFYGNNSLYLELDYLDTSNVTNMRHMFNSSQATTLDLSSFDTSIVTDMDNMFRDSQVTPLDLSSFDTSSVTDMRYMFQWYMFENSQAITGYARTQADADNFNSSSGKPSTLTFVVK